MFDDLQPEDFNKELDKELFEQWKTAKREQQKVRFTPIIFWLTGSILLLTISSFIGYIVFFGFAITGLLILLPKNKKVTQIQEQLGITNHEVYLLLDEIKKNPKK